MSVLQKFLVDALTRFDDDVDEIHATDPADENGGGQDEFVRRTVTHRYEDTDHCRHILQSNITRMCLLFNIPQEN